VHTLKSSQKFNIPQLRETATRSFSFLAHITRIV